MITWRHCSSHVQAVEEVEANIVRLLALEEELRGTLKNGAQRTAELEKIKWVWLKRCWGVRMSEVGSTSQNGWLLVDPHKLSKYGWFVNIVIYDVSWFQFCIGHIIQIDHEKIERQIIHIWIICVVHKSSILEVHVEPILLSHTLQYPLDPPRPQRFSKAGGQDPE